MAVSFYIDENELVNMITAGMSQRFAKLVEQRLQEEANRIVAEVAKQLVLDIEIVLNTYKQRVPFDELNIQLVINNKAVDLSK